MGAFSFPLPGTGNDPLGSDQSFDPTQYILGTEQLVANTYLANQAITSPRGATVQLAPNGNVVASGGGASAPLGGSGFAQIFSNPLVLILVVLFLVSILKH